MWTVKQIIGHLERFNPDSKVFFQDRLGRHKIKHELCSGVKTLDVIIGVLEDNKYTKRWADEDEV